MKKEIPGLKNPQIIVLTKIGCHVGFVSEISTLCHTSISIFSIFRLRIIRMSVKFFFKEMSLDIIKLLNLHRKLIDDNYCVRFVQTLVLLSGQYSIVRSRLNLMKLLSVYLGAWLSQVNRARHLNKRLKVL
jgi:hypothetical protein